MNAKKLLREIVKLNPTNTRVAESDATTPKTIPTGLQITLPDGKPGAETPATAAPTECTMCFTSCTSPRINCADIPKLNLEDLPRLLSLPKSQILWAAKAGNARFSRITSKTGRLVLAPHSEMKTVSRNLLWFLELLPPRPSKFAYAYVKGHNYHEFQAYHEDSRFEIKSDLEQFFPSINARRVFGVFHLVYKFSELVAGVLTNICTNNDTLALGLSTSPLLSNIVCKRLDSRLAIHAQKWRWYYSRYSDDIWFSSTKPLLGARKFWQFAERIIKDESFSVNLKKLSLSANY